MSPTRRALLVIDVQNDFISGSVALPRDSQGRSSEHVVEKINALSSLQCLELIVFTQDWHPSDHASFENSTPRNSVPIDKWPVHCVQASWGAELHKQLNVNIDGKKTFLVKKGIDPYTDGYSAFDSNAKPDNNLELLLRDNQIDQVYVCGLAFDYCVRMTALDAGRLGFQTCIIIDACHAVKEQSFLELQDLFAKENIEMVVSDSLMASN